MFHRALVSATNPYHEESIEEDQEPDFIMSSVLRISDFLPRQAHLELYRHHLEGGGAGQDGGVGLEKARQCCPTVPEEQRVPGQEAGAEVRFTNQD